MGLTHSSQLGREENISYDPFGNLAKSGSPYAFQASYSTSTNQITCIGGSGSNCSGGMIPSYDANGNVENDSLHNYSWDAEGRPVAIDSVGAAYDALGRMVEQNRSGSYTEIVYSPTGQKLVVPPQPREHGTWPEESESCRALATHRFGTTMGTPDLAGAVVASRSKSHSLAIPASD